MATWQLLDAGNRLAEVVAAAKSSGSQIIARDGVDEVVVVPIEEWERLNQRKPTLLEVLQSGPQGELSIPPRGQYKMRKPINFED